MNNYSDLMSKINEKLKSIKDTNKHREFRTSIGPAWKLLTGGMPLRTKTRNWCINHIKEKLDEY